MTKPDQTIPSIFEQAQRTAATLIPVMTSGPSGLSDYAVSPLGMPELLTEPGQVPLTHRPRRRHAH